MPPFRPDLVSPRFVRFVANGLLAAGLHFAVLFVNLEVLHFRSAGLANFVAALFGATASFQGNRHFVFRAAAGNARRQAGRFVALYALTTLSHGAILYAWTDRAHLDYRAGFIIATLFQLVLSYVGNRNVVFRMGDA
jgi:putative flippase GtrA